MTPRNKRLLELLAKRDKVFVAELRPLIGALNPAQNALKLRQQGWDIKMDRTSIRDRDGKLCSPGYYWFEISEKNRAQEYLRKTDKAAATAQSANDDPKLNKSESSVKADSSLKGRK